MNNWYDNKINVTGEKNLASSLFSALNVKTKAHLSQQKELIMSEMILLNDVTPYEFVKIKTYKPLFRAEQLIGITIRNPKNLFSDEIIEIQNIKSIEVIGTESGRSVGGAAVGAVVGTALTGGVGGLLLGGAVGAGRNKIPIFIHLTNGDRKYVNIKKKHIGALEALIKVLQPLTTNGESDLRDEIDCPWCAERILAKAKICKHCGKEMKQII